MERPSYKDYLRAVGRNPLPVGLRTTKAPGDLELKSGGGVHTHSAR